MAEDYTVTADNLDTIFIRAQDANGLWGNVNLREATDQQFAAWAHSRVPIEGEGWNDPWPEEERIAFCQWLQVQQGPLVRIRREVLEN